MTAGYRPEIDGLRALAVVPVMLFHGGVTGFSGGFTGVDVFFVISGYLITSILLEEQRSGRFSIAGFYERRARRILPALFLVAICTIPFAWMWMPDRQLEEFGQSLMATSLFVSNIHFWAESNYFGSAAEEKPLLHTWSLAIEEQFYLLFPLLLAFVWWFRKRWLLPVTIIIAAVSLALALLPLAIEQETRFFLIPARAWELLAGAALAMLLQDTALKESRIKPVAGVLAGVGVLLLIASMASIDQSTAFPGPATILPVLGTALIIAFADGTNWTGRLLGSPALVGIGLISYSAYLWHQPLFAFARLRSLNEPSQFFDDWVVRGCTRACLPELALRRETVPRQALAQPRAGFRGIGDFRCDLDRTRRRNQFVRTCRKPP
ncbi:MAG: acyltransferase [Rhizobiales bacterium]|nr:acyltransferase [Hyphomicrobiales bacterium]